MVTEKTIIEVTDTTIKKKKVITMTEEEVDLEGGSGRVEISHQ